MQDENNASAQRENVRPFGKRPESGTPIIQMIKCNRKSINFNFESVLLIVSNGNVLVWGNDKMHSSMHFFQSLFIQELMGTYVLLLSEVGTLITSDGIYQINDVNIRN